MISYSTNSSEWMAAAFGANSHRSRKLKVHVVCDHALIRNPTPPTGSQLQLNLMQTFLYSHAATESAMQSDCANNYREETHLRHSSQCYQRLVELYRDHPGHILSFIMSHPNRPIQDTEEEFEAGVISPILWMASKMYCSQAESIISCLASHYTAVGLLAISIASQCPEQTPWACVVGKRITTLLIRCWPCQ